MSRYDLTVLLSTYNRAPVLRETLTAMAEVNWDGIRVQFVVVDNNSTDDTHQVLESFVDRLPLVSLFESRPGKNSALNKALNECELGEIVVLTDDDVTPDDVWLQHVHACCLRWPAISVFGGRVDAAWPECGPPTWALRKEINHWGYAHTDWGSHEEPFEDATVPVGPNMWVRRDVFTDGWRFDESVGPRPGKRRMGSETTFLIRLRQAGYDMIYCPAAIVQHRIQASEISVAAIRKRALTSGRGVAYINYRVRGDKARVNKISRSSRHLLGFLKQWLRVMSAYLVADETDRVVLDVEARRWAAYHISSFTLLWTDSLPMAASGNRSGKASK